MEFIDLKKETPKEDVPIVVTDGKNYCCVEYYDVTKVKYGGDGWIVMGCMATYMYSDVEINFEPTHFAYINKDE